MDNKNGWLMSNQHTNQLKKHILAVSTCKIHRLKTNSTSVTALNMVRCLYLVGVFSWRKVRLCVCVKYMCVDTHMLLAIPLGEILGHCVYMYYPKECDWVANQCLATRDDIWDLGEISPKTHPQVAIWLQLGSCSLLDLFLFTLLGVQHLPLVVTSCLPPFR